MVVCYLGFVKFNIEARKENSATIIELCFSQGFWQYQAHLIMILYEAGIIQCLKQVFIEFYSVFLRS